MKQLAFRLVASAVVGFCGTAANATTYNYIPAKISFSNLSSAGGGKVCVIGTSLQQVGGNGVPAVSPYFLTTNKQKQGVWSLVGAAQKSVSAFELGTDIVGVTPSPSGAQPYINAATIRFYVIKKSSTVQCSDIQYTYSNTATGDLNLAYYPYPFALLEMSAYPKANLPKSGDTSNVLTIDTSNVDDFQIPLLMQFSKSGTVLGQIGNPASPVIASRKTMISGPADTGGAKSPFVTWLRGQPGYAAGPKLFEVLALSSVGWNSAAPASSTAGSFPYAMIKAPTGYLSYKCLQVPPANWTVPAGCGTNGLLINAAAPLGGFYDAEIATFFKNAYQATGAGSPALTVMGDADADAPIAQLPWTVVSNTASCPVYLKPDKQSLQFKSSYKTPIILCNPVGQVVSLGAAPIAYTQTQDTVGKISTAQLQITQAQFTKFKSKVGYNLGQPESGWIGNITGFTQSGGKYYINLNVVGTPIAPAAQRLCTVTAPSGNQPNCPQANTTFKTWLFTNIQRGSSIDPFESPTQMVFGNDGVFSSWLYYTNPSLMKVTQSIERNIVWAFAHGVANCNNVTMSTAKLRPAYCAKVARLSAASYNTGAFGASDAYWSNEKNWFPAGGTQNYYAQYLHTARLADATGAVVPGACSGSCFNIFAPPNRSIGKPANSNQGVPMGMAYGFGYDENPDYLTAPIAQVPSKLDPIPSAWGTNIAVAVKIGRSW